MNRGAGLRRGKRNQEKISPLKNEKCTLIRVATRESSIPRQPFTAKRSMSPSSKPFHIEPISTENRDQNSFTDCSGLNWTMNSRKTSVDIISSNDTTAVTDPTISHSDQLKQIDNRIRTAGRNNVSVIRVQRVPTADRNDLSIEDETNPTKSGVNSSAAAENNEVLNSSTNHSKIQQKIERKRAKRIKVIKLPRIKTAVNPDKSIP